MKLHIHTKGLKLFKGPIEPGWIALPARPCDPWRLAEGPDLVAMILASPTAASEFGRCKALALMMGHAVHQYASNIEDLHEKDVVLSHSGLQAVTSDAINYRVSMPLGVRVYWYGLPGYPAPNLSPCERISRDKSVTIRGLQPVPYETINDCDMIFESVLGDPRVMVSFKALLPSAKHYVNVSTRPVRYDSLLEVIQEREPSSHLQSPPKRGA